MTALDRLDAIRERAEKATERPWWREGCDIFSERTPSATSHDIATHVWSEADANFITHSRADLPALESTLRKVLELSPDPVGISSAEVWSAHGQAAMLSEVHRVIEEELEKING